MTSQEMRANPLFMRNEFNVDGKWGFPIIRKQALDLNNIELIACSDTSRHDTKNLYKGVHFFVDDYRFESVYNSPARGIEKYGRYKFLLTPDFSLYSDMNLWRQIESVGKSRWVGAKWQSVGLTVIPTLSWSLTRSYEFCFDAIDKHCIVAIGMIGCKHEKKEFLRGYYQMLTHIEPEAVICFGTPYKEMGGNIVVIDYNNSRKGVR